MPSVAEPRRTLSEADVWAAEAPARPPEVFWGRTVDLGAGIRIVLGPDSPRWLYPVLNRLQHLLTLRPNWDTYGALPIHPNSILYVLQFLEATMGQTARAPQVVPTSKGGLQLEWHANNVELEIEIDSTAVFALSFEQGGMVDERQGSALAPEGIEPIITAATA